MLGSVVMVAYRMLNSVLPKSVIHFLSFNQLNSTHPSNHTHCSVIQLHRISIFIGHVSWPHIRQLHHQRIPCLSVVTGTLFQLE